MNDFYHLREFKGGSGSIHKAAKMVEEEVVSSSSNVHQGFRHDFMPWVIHRQAWCFSDTDSSYGLMEARRHAILG
jgi:hypothetical protein